MIVYTMNDEIIMSVILCLIFMLTACTMLFAIKLAPDLHILSPTLQGKELGALSLTINVWGSN